MNELALFAGAGGGILGGVLNGWRVIGAVECEAYPRGILCARQNDGMLPAFPIWSDVRSFTKRNNATRHYIRWLRSIAHELVITGGFPCQDISAAGKGEGITGERSGLWKEFGRIIGEIRPRCVLVENSPVLTSRGLGVVLEDLAALGYDAEWGVVGAEDAIWAAGTPCLDHQRERIWICAENADARKNTAGRLPVRASAEYARAGIISEDAARACDDTDDTGCPWQKLPQPKGWKPAAESAGAGGEHGGETEHADETRREQQWSAEPDGEELIATECTGWWSAEPAVGRVVDGMAHRVDRLAALGNGQVPGVVRIAWEILRRRLEQRE